MNENPLVSVVMPVYNAARYVGEAIESILSQKFTNFELLVFDDGSSDDSLSLLRAYARHDSRLRIFTRAHEGMTRRLNESLVHARGQYIARMDADDVSLESRLAEQVHYLKEDPGCVAVGTDLVMISDDGKELAIDRHECDHGKMVKLLLNGALGVITHATSMMPRQALIDVGGYREECDGLEDFDLLLRLSEIGRLANIPQVLFKVRMHADSVCARRFRTQARLFNKILTEARARRGLSPSSQNTWPVVHPSDDEAARLQLWSGCFLSMGQRSLALRYAFLAIRKHPLDITSWIALGRVVLPRSIKLGLKAVLRPCWMYERPAR